LSIGANNYPAEYYRRWQKPGDEHWTNIPSMIYPVPFALSRRSEFYQFSEITVKRGDHVRLQDVRFSYHVSRRKFFLSAIKDLQLFFYPNNLNLILWRADYSNYDPDFAGVLSSPGAVPPSRTWTIGVILNF